MLGTAKDTKLAEKSADLVLVLDVYHHLDYPGETLGQLRRALKPGGRLAIVEYHKNDIAMNGDAKEHVRLGEAEAIAEIEANGFRLLSKKKDFVPEIQWLGIFEAKLGRDQARCRIFGANLLRNFWTLGRTTKRQYGCIELRW